MKTEAVVITTTGWSSGIISSIIQNTSPYYDFYLPREAADISPDLKVPNNQYAGRRFTNAIIEADVDQTGSYSAIDLIQRELNDDPVSAIEYCLNKNRRNKLTGRVDKTDRGWYLPAIDEIEEIMVAGYTDFEVFQNKMYWSCQTAFHKNHFLYSSTILSDSDFKGDYYRENTNSARATSALYLGVDSDGKDIYTYAGSGVINDGYYESMEISVFSGGSDAQAVIIPADGKVIRYWDGSYDFIFQHYIDILLNQVKYDVGYNSRGQKINRVRCVRNSGTAADI